MYTCPKCETSFDIPEEGHNEIIEGREFKLLCPCCKTFALIVGADKEVVEVDDEYTLSEFNVYSRDYDSIKDVESKMEVFEGKINNYEI